MGNEKPKLTEEPGDSPRSSRPTGSRIFVVAHTGVQLDVFLRAHGIPKDFVRRVRTISDTRGLHDETLYLLPGWHEGTMEPGVVHEWSCRVGRVVNITEAVARGEESFSNAKWSEPGNKGATSPGALFEENRP